MKKLFVNQTACIGCGACVAIDGEHFDFNDDGLSNVISNENIDNPDTQNAVSSCPTNAISYIEEDGDTTLDENKKCDNPNCTCEHCECEECNCDGENCQ